MVAQGELKHIKDLKFWGPADVLMSKYSFDPEVARLIESFILPCLNVNPSTWEWARTVPPHMKLCFSVVGVVCNLLGGTAFVRVCVVVWSCGRVVVWSQSVVRRPRTA